MKTIDKRCDHYLPVLIYPSNRSEILWGRLTLFHSKGLNFISKFEIEKEKNIAASFKLGNVKFDNLRLQIQRKIKDVSGYWIYKADFIDSEQKEQVIDEITEFLTW